ncbi:CGNR zinc finger domain-containing protein [Agromyces sp. MMS24-JH15]|uniref:CGNR zinc finger domain-containing protein n=1 Tax=Agromyces sp. MMS24-JH15 TaxID=3243765 RepID=UPI003749D7B2
MPVSTVTIPVGQWFTSSDGQRWWFDSGSFALDFAYTGPMGQGSPGVEQLHSPDDLTSWIASRFPMPVGAARTRDLFDAVGLRDAIARLAHAASAGEPLRSDDVDTVNLFAATPDIPPVLGGGARRAGRSVQSVGQALATIAREAVDLFSPENLERVRCCSAEDCGIVYLDTSRAATRRWCSMQRCGNRAKVRAHRARKSGAGRSRLAAAAAAAAASAPVASSVVAATITVPATASPAAPAPAGSDAAGAASPHPDESAA